ncbi:MAG: polysaccharide deacetylase family protein [Caldilineaceae bacterium]
MNVRATPTPFSSPSPTAHASPRPPTPLAQLQTPTAQPMTSTVWLTSPTLVAVLKPYVTVTITPTDAVTATALPAASQPVAQVTPSPARQPTPDGQARTAKVPILMYHYVSTPPQDANIYRLDLSVKPALFAAQLDRMQADGYTTISLYDLVGNLTQGAPLPPKPVILTFDDGYRDAYENAFPLLKAHGMKATFFVITDFIDEKQPEYLTWDMARTMLAAGMSIESHSRNHASLRKRDKDFLVWQALGSLETIKYELGVQPRFICYPAGEYDQTTIDIFKSANYWAGITTQQGATQRSDDLFELHRVRIRGTTTPDELARLLSLDW